jgi:hypothetical protein
MLGIRVKYKSIEQLKHSDTAQVSVAVGASDVCHSGQEPTAKSQELIY